MTVQLKFSEEGMKVQNKCLRKECLKIYESVGKCKPIDQRSSTIAQYKSHKRKQHQKPRRSTAWWCWLLSKVSSWVINSESPMMRPCHIQERNQNASPWCRWTKSKPRFEFSALLSVCPLSLPVCMLCESISAPAWELTCQSVLVPVCANVSKCMSVPNKGLSLLNSTDIST